MVIMIRQLLTSLIVAGSLLATGCTLDYSFRIPDVSLRHQGEEYAVDRKIDLAVNLCLKEELKGAKWEKHFPLGGSDLIPIGNQLAKNASELSEILFRDVVITCTPAASGDRQPEAILTPRVVAIDRTYGFRTYHESILSLVLEWKLEDVHNNPIWVDSIKGEGRGESQPIFDRDRKSGEQVEMLLKDLFGKSLRAIWTSPEIRQYVEKHRRGMNQVTVSD